MPAAPLARLCLTAFTLLFCSLAPANPPAAVQQPEPPSWEAELDVDYTPTPMPAVRRMLELAKVGPEDHLVDLGSGDGRILITAARQYGVRSAIGVELDPWLVEYATAQAFAAGVGDRVKFMQADLFETDFANADVVSMYLLPHLNLKLRPYILDRLSPGTRIVSHSFDMGDWVPDEQDVLFNRGVYLWIVPAKVAGSWTVELNHGAPIELTLSQQFQKISGKATRSGKPLPVSDLTLNGAQIRFSIDGEVYEGRVQGPSMQSTGVLPWFAMRR